MVRAKEICAVQGSADHLKREGWQTNRGVSFQRKDETQPASANSLESKGPETS